jgi:predicted small integral membrane protein
MNIRKILAGTVLIATLTALFLAWFLSQRPAVVQDVPYTDLVKESLKVRQDESRSAFQLAILLLGGIWATLLAKKDQARFTFTDKPETIMFCSSNVLLLTSVYFHLAYLDFIGRQLWMSGQHDLKSIPDIYNSFLNNPYASQLVTLAAGLICTAIHLTAVHQFREKE